jgi:hypothetical protein
LLKLLRTNYIFCLSVLVPFNILLVDYNERYKIWNIIKSDKDKFVYIFMHRFIYNYFLFILFYLYIFFYNIFSEISIIIIYISRFPRSSLVHSQEKILRIIIIELLFMRSFYLYGSLPFFHRKTTLLLV